MPHFDISQRTSTEDLGWTFRDLHRRDHDPDNDLYCKAALALRRIKGSTNAHDPWVWAVLAERLLRAGYPVDWMFEADVPDPIVRNPGRVRSIYNQSFYDDAVGTVEDLFLL